MFKKQFYFLNRSRYGVSNTDNISKEMCTVLRTYKHGISGETMYDIRIDYMPSTGTISLSEYITIDETRFHLLYEANKV